VTEPKFRHDNKSKLEIKLLIDSNCDYGKVEITGVINVKGDQSGKPNQSLVAIVMKMLSNGF